MKLGNKVSGTYHGVKFSGVLDAYDGSGYVYVKLDAFLTVYGIRRDELAFSPYERDEIKVDAEGETGEIGSLPSTAVGGEFRVPSVEERRADFARYRGDARMDRATFNRKAAELATELAKGATVEPKHWIRAAQKIWAESWGQ